VLALPLSNELLELVLVERVGLKQALRVERPRLVEVLEVLGHGLDLGIILILSACEKRVP
jgi:hypothetical protein